MKPDRIDRQEARRLAEEEFQRFAELAAALTPDEWTLPTDCSSWDVRKIALHVLGSADAQASVREFMHQMRRGLSLNKQIDSHHWVDGLNELQIRERANLSDSTWDSPATSGATVSTSATQPAGRWSSRPTTMAALSPTSSPSGPRSTGSRST